MSSTAEGRAIAAYRLSPGQRRIFDAAALTLTEGVIRLRAEASAARVRAALEEVCARHEILRSVFRSHPVSGEPLQLVLDEPGLSADMDGANLKLALSPLAADAATLRIIAHELDAVLQGRTLPPVTRQFADIAAWQNDMAASGDGNRFAFDEDAARAFRMPFESNVTAVRRELPLPRDVDAQAFAFAALHALLARLTGAREIAVATRFAGRPYDELRDVPGPLATVIPIVTHPHREQPFRELVAAIENECARAHAVEDCFDRDLQAIRVFAEFLDVDPLESVSVPTGPHPIAFVFQRTGESLRVELRCGEADLVAEEFATLFAHALADPATAIEELRIVGEGERRALDGAARGPQMPYARLLPEQFAQQAAHDGGRIALEHLGETATYAELDRRANQLAHALHARGVQRGDLVAISIARSIEMVVAVLGVLKAGAAYVPFDLSYPRLRLEQIAGDAQPKLWLAEVPDHDHLPAHPAKVLFVDADADVVAQQPDTAPVIDLDATDVAYVIYTSGSTGVPKGVAVTHGGLANYVTWAAAAYDVANGSGTLVHSPLGFDLTVTSLLVPLVAGQRAILVDEGFGVEPLAAALRHHRDLSLVKLTPAHLDALRYTHGEDTIDVRLFVVGGEALASATVAWWRNRAPHTRIINEYGPTETVVGCIVHDVRGDEPEPVPIGRPIANTLAYVLDDRLDPVPFGVEGELCIGGAGVARGYLHREKLTDERFVTLASGERVYRTGDRARVLRDGTFEFRGRADDQVKVRGHRVELGEIEAVLRQHPGVREAAVVSTASDGDTRLVGFVVPQHDASAALPELRAFVAARLPEVMVPGAFVAIPALPLGPHGKVDRKALAQLDTVPLLAPASATAPPRTALEAAIAQIWSGVLGRPQAGIHDNFFDLGGHSLAATQVVSRMQSIFGADVSLRAVFESPTVAGLATALVQRQAELGEPSEVEAALAEVEAMNENEVRRLLAAEEV